MKQTYPVGIQNELINIFTRFQEHLRIGARRGGEKGRGLVERFRISEKMMFRYVNRRCVLWRGITRGIRKSVCRRKSQIAIKTLFCDSRTKLYHTRFEARLSKTNPLCLFLRAYNILHRTHPTVFYPVSSRQIPTERIHPRMYAEIHKYIRSGIPTCCMYV